VPVSSGFVSFAGDAGVVASPDGGLGWAATVTLGEAARSVRVPPAVARCFVCHVAAPALDGAVAPGPPPDVAPYTTSKAPPFARVRPVTVIVWPPTASVPAVEVA
jgi:hypothetical protein